MVWEQPRASSYTSLVTDGEHTAFCLLRASLSLLMQGSESIGTGGFLSKSPQHTGLPINIPFQNRCKLVRTWVYVGCVQIVSRSAFWKADSPKVTHLPADVLTLREMR